jgi:hypothetical protein
MAGRKAITTIIAILLAVMLTLAVSLSAFLFIQKTQKSAQGVTESSFYNFMQRTSSCAKLASFKFNPVTNISEMVIKNCGFREIDLSNENLHLLIKTQDKSCAFTLNSTNCANCVGKLGIGSFVTLQINASAVYCASTLADLLNAAVGQTVEIVLFDKASSFNAAITFIPEPVVICNAGLNRPPDANNASWCYNYTLINLGNAPDRFEITVPQWFFPGSPTIQLFNGSNCTGTPTNLLITPEIPINSTVSFSVFIDLEGGGSSCPGLYCNNLCYVNVESLNCVGKSKKDNINQVCVW